MLKSIRGYLKKIAVSGVLMLVPFVATSWIIVGTVNLFDSLFLTIMPERFRILCSSLKFPGYGVVIFVLGVFVLGVFARTVVGSFVVRLFESSVRRMPMIGAIYSTVKNLFSALVVHENDQGQEVALVEYPKEGVWVFCFVTGKAPDKVHEAIGDSEAYVTVFIPTSPNPTSGFLVMTSESKLRYINMTNEQGMRYVISAGMAEGAAPLKGS